MKQFKHIKLLLTVLTLCLFSITAYSHGVDEETQKFLLGNNGIAFGPFLYIGAKHMITGYDHILFLIGVIFFLYKPKEILIYVSFFTIGHSLTLLFGVLFDLQINAFLIDAIIALSIVYKGFDNLNGFKQLFGKQPNTKITVLIFGLFHGLGLATKIQEFGLNEDGLLINLLGFNLGVEIGQFLALGFVLLIISFWRRHKSFMYFSKTTNILLMASGFVLLAFQLTGFYLSKF